MFTIMITIFVSFFEWFFITGVLSIFIYGIYLHNKEK